MIDTLIFDFGDVFINLDKAGARQNALDLFGINDFSPEMSRINALYETGKLNTEEFLGFYSNCFPGIHEDILKQTWNAIIRDFPPYRLEFLRDLRDKRQFRLILLSNTNELHIDHVKQQVSFYEEFKSCFNSFYLSHEIGYRKPDSEIFEWVLAQQHVQASRCFFIDDTAENTLSAEALGIKSWNIDPSTEDLIDLFKKFPNLI